MRHPPIVFDPDDRRLGETAYPSRKMLLDACVPADPDSRAYQAFASSCGVEAITGSIVTTANNPDLLYRRREALKEQLYRHRSCRPDETILPVELTIPPTLEHAFKQAAQNPKSPFKVVSYTTVRENLFFDLSKKFPELGLEMVNVVIDNGHAERCNDIVKKIAPDLRGKLIYEAGINDELCDIFMTSAAIIYLDKTGIENLAKRIAAKQPQHVVFNNVVQNDVPGGYSRWFAQRYSGGIIPFRKFGKGELASVMKRVGYELVEAPVAPPSIHISIPEVQQQNPVMENYSFRLVG